MSDTSHAARKFISRVDLSIGLIRLALLTAAVWLFGWGVLFVLAVMVIERVIAPTEALMDEAKRTVRN